MQGNSTGDRLGFPLVAPPRLADSSPGLRRELSVAPVPAPPAAGRTRSAECACGRARGGLKEHGHCRHAVGGGGWGQEMARGAEPPGSCCDCTSGSPGGEHWLRRGRRARGGGFEQQLATRVTSRAPRGCRSHQVPSGVGGRLHWGCTCAPSSGVLTGLAVPVCYGSLWEGRPPWWWWA